MNAAEHFHHPPFKAALPGFSFLLPGRWEVSAYTLAEDAGSLQFASEKGAHGQFSWRKVKAVPDIPRILEEIHRRHLGAEAPLKIRFTRHGRDGRVILAHTKTPERFYASVFNRSAMQLNEWIFPEYSRGAVETVLPMLDSYADNLPGDDGRIFHALFGLEVSIPENFRLTGIDAYPAAITMNFENRRRHTIRAHRWGMADLRMEGANLTNFYHRFLYANRFAVKSAETIPAVSGCEAAEVCYRARGKYGFDFLLGPWWRGFGASFLRKSENRIYAFEHLTPPLTKEHETLKKVFRVKLAERD